MASVPQGFRNLLGNGNFERWVGSETSRNLLGLLGIGSGIVLRNSPGSFHQLLTLTGFLFGLRMLVSVWCFDEGGFQFSIKQSFIDAGNSGAGRGFGTLLWDGSRHTAVSSVVLNTEPQAGSQSRPAASCLDLSPPVQKQGCVSFRLTGFTDSSGGPLCADLTPL